jgi:hypothetical protein
MIDCVCAAPDDIRYWTVQPMVTWRSRYNGFVAIAYLDDKAIAGISGPWSERFALTWWDRPLPALELFDSLEEARQKVEDWALRVSNGYAVAALEPVRESIRQPGVFGRMRALMPDLGRHKSPTPARETIAQLRRRHQLHGNDIGDLHFAACDAILPSDSHPAGAKKS